VSKQLSYSEEHQNGRLLSLRAEIESDDRHEPNVRPSSEATSTLQRAKHGFIQLLAMLSSS
jgi:hypothetical protein